MDQTSISQSAKGLAKSVRYNEVRYIEVPFHIFYYKWGKENRFLYQGLHYIEVRYVKVPLYQSNWVFTQLHLQNFPMSLISFAI